MAIGQNPPGQAARAIPDKMPVTFNRMRRKTQLLQPGVRGVGDINQRVEQRAVDIEKYGLKVDCISLR